MEVDMPAVIYEKIENIVTITMNRPEKLNAMNPQMLVELAKAWVDFRDDTDARVAILTGAGNKAFCAGADLGSLLPLLTRSRKPADEWDEALLRDRSIQMAAILRGFELYKPVIAAVNGLALAGGTEVIGACDLRVAAPHATLGLSEVKRGVAPGGGSMVRLARQIPYAKAMQILLTGEAMSAEEAHRIGLLNEILPAEALRDRSMAMARLIAENAPLAVQACKEVVLRTSGLSFDEANAVEDEVAVRVLKTNDAVEGPLAFVEKRKPIFTGT
jgi:enoyl-CoA hydratase